MNPKFEADPDDLDADDEDFEPRPPIHPLRRPQASMEPPPMTTSRWRPNVWSGIRILEDIPEIRSQDSLEIRSGNI